MKNENVRLYLCDSVEDALLVYTIKRWIECSNIPLGRTIIQKICYFLKSFGIPFSFTYELYNYGPFSFELYDKMDELVADEVIVDEYAQKNKAERSVYKLSTNAQYLISKYEDNINKYKEKIDEIVNIFKEFNHLDLELASTILYFIKSYENYFSKKPNIDEVIEGVIKIKKNKFSVDMIRKKYEYLVENLRIN